MLRFDGATFWLLAASTKAFAAPKMLNSRIGLPTMVWILYFNMQAAGMHFAERSYRAWLDAAYTYGRNDVIFTRDRNQKWLLPAVRKEFKRSSYFDSIACPDLQRAISAEPGLRPRR